MKMRVLEEAAWRAQYRREEQLRETMTSHHMGRGEILTGDSGRILRIFDNKMNFELLLFPCINIIQLAIHVSCTVKINTFLS